MVTPQVIPCHTEGGAAGQEPKKVQNQAKGGLCSALILSQGNHCLSICILHPNLALWPKALFGLVCTEFGRKPAQKPGFTIGLVWLSYLRNIFVPNCSEDGPLLCLRFPEHKTQSETGCILIRFSARSSLPPSSHQQPKKHLQNSDGKTLWLDLI